MEPNIDVDRLMSEDEFARQFFETDLSDLPAPRRGRHPILMVAVMVFSVVLMWLFHEEAFYFFEAKAPTDLGDTMRFRADHRVNPAHRPPSFVHNTYVRLAGLTAFRTESESSNDVFLKLAYVPVYVHMKETGPRRPSDSLVHLTVSGRLLDLRRSQDYRSVQRFYAQRFDLPTKSGFMLVAEAKPKSFWWALPLQGLFLLFIVINGAMLVRTFRR